MAAAGGIPLVAFNVPLDWDAASDSAAVIAPFMEAHPEGYFYIRVWLGASQAWLDAHPESRMRLADGTAIPWVSPASREWRDEAARLLQAKLKEIARGPYAERFIGVHLTAQMAGEWFYPETNSFLDYSDANLEGYRAWLKERYVNDKGLRRAWGDDAASLVTVSIPTPEQREEAVWGPFRDPARQRPMIDYQRYLSDTVAGAIEEFARAAKRATGDRALVGVFYGYTLEINGIGPTALANSGHLALRRVLECDDLDIIHAPYSYMNRELGNPPHFHLPLDSPPLHGKVVVIEEDSRTHLASDVPEAYLASGNVAIAGDVEEMLSANRRNMAAFLAHRAGMWYFDVLSDGRWNSKEFWTSAALTRRLFAEARGPGAFAPEIAVVVSEASVHALRASTHPYLMETLSFWREELDRLGTPVGYYLQSDLPRLPDSVKVLIAANAYVIDDLERRALDRFLARGGTVVWVFAPDIVGENGVDLGRVTEVTGMSIAPLDGAQRMAFRSAVTEETWALADTWEPRLAVTSRDNVHAIATYAGTDAVAVAATPFKGGISVYAAVPRLPAGVMRWICGNSGVHLYRDTPGMTATFGPYFVVHTDAAGVHAFRLPEKAARIDRIVPYASLPVAVDSAAWRDELPARTTAIYRVVE